LSQCCEWLIEIVGLGNRTAAGFQVEVESGFNCLADDVG